MIFKTILILSMFVFASCGDNQKTKTETIAETATEIQNETDILNPPKIPKTLTIYIHGFSKTGYKRKGLFGDVESDDLVDNLAKFANLPTLHDYDKESFKNVLSTTTYYGDEAPAYYSLQDIDDIEKLTKKYGGGIPRYATIIAKFIKQKINYLDPRVRGMNRFLIYQ